MFDPSQITLGQASSAIRDFTVVAFLLTTSWKLRGFYEIIRAFFARITHHMDVMEAGMTTLLTNHLSHMEADLKAIAGRKPDLVQVDETEK